MQNKLDSSKQIENSYFLKNSNFFINKHLRLFIDIRHFNMV